MEVAENIVFILSAALLLTCGYTQNITCGANEVVDNCPRNCPAEYCPTSELQDRSPCPYPDNCPSPSCVCRFNYRRAASKTCIPTTSCPAFECSKPNEEYDSCPALCPTDSCADAHFNGVCPFYILIILNCNPKCKCKDGFCRQNNTCIPYNKNDNETYGGPFFGRRRKNITVSTKVNTSTSSTSMA